MTLAEFLLARIADDERWATWGAGRWDQRRVLVECEAKRRIVNACARTAGLTEPRPGYLADFVLAQLALPYADHPDYQQEWKPK